MELKTQYVTKSKKQLEKKKMREEDLTLTALLRIDEQYMPLVTLFEQFSPGEEGNQSNTKLRYFETTISSICSDEARLINRYEARVYNGNKVPVLASLLLQYLRAVLVSDDIRAHRSLARQVTQNGREVFYVLALLSPPPVSTIRLLLSADLSVNNFLPLPNLPQQIYVPQLEQATEENLSKDSYGSLKNSPEKDDTGGIAEDVGMNLQQISLKNNEHTKPKLRWILDAGVEVLGREQRTLEPQMPVRVKNRKQKNKSLRSVENWQQEKSDIKKYLDRNRQKKITLQKLNDEDENEKLQGLSTSRNRGGRPARGNRRCALGTLKREKFYSVDSLCI